MISFIEFCLINEINAKTMKKKVSVPQYHYINKYIYIDIQKNEAAFFT